MNPQKFSFPAPADACFEIDSMSFEMNGKNGENGENDYMSLAMDVNGGNDGGNVSMTPVETPVENLVTEDQMTQVINIIKKYGKYADQENGMINPAKNGKQANENGHEITLGQKYVIEGFPYCSGNVFRFFLQLEQYFEKKYISGQKDFAKGNLVIEKFAQSQMTFEEARQNGKSFVSLECFNSEIFPCNDNTLRLIKEASAKLLKPTMNSHNYADALDVIVPVIRSLKNQKGKKGKAILSALRTHYKPVFVPHERQHIEIVEKVSPIAFLLEQALKKISKNTGQEDSTPMDTIAEEEWVTVTQPKQSKRVHTEHEPNTKVERNGLSRKAFAEQQKKRKITQSEQDVKAARPKRSEQGTKAAKVTQSTKSVKATRPARSEQPLKVEQVTQATRPTRSEPAWKTLPVQNVQVVEPAQAVVVDHVQAVVEPVQTRNINKDLRGGLSRKAFKELQFKQKQNGQITPVQTPVVLAETVVEPVVVEPVIETVVEPVIVETVVEPVVIAETIFETVLEPVVIAKTIVITEVDDWEQIVDEPSFVAVNSANLINLNQIITSTISPKTNSVPSAPCVSVPSKPVQQKSTPKKSFGTLKSMKRRVLKKLRIDDNEFEGIESRYLPKLTEKIEGREFSKQYLKLF
jgi:hypothetical protein